MLPLWRLTGRGFTDSVSTPTAHNVLSQPRLHPGRSDRGLMCMNPYACLQLCPLQLLGSAGAGQGCGSSSHSCIAKHYRTHFRDIQRTAYTPAHTHTYNALANKDVTKAYKRTLSWGIQLQFAVASDANAHGRNTLVTSQQHKHRFPCACIPPPVPSHH